MESTATEAPAAEGLSTFYFTIARDGDTFGADYVVQDEETAQLLAVEDINEAWRTSYADWDEMVSDCDGHTLNDAGDVMVDALPLATLVLYRVLADGLREMVKGGRLTEADIPDDFQWLKEQLASIATADPLQS